MCNIGILYYRGTGAPQRYDLAMRWFHDAASAGNTQAMFNIGAMYRDGVGETVDFAEAMTWFLKAATNFNDKAMNSIGAMYRNGQGVSIDYVQAALWYRRAADHGGNQAAMYNVSGPCMRQGLGVLKDADEEARRVVCQGVSQRFGQ